MEARMKPIRAIAYWTLTLIIGWEMIAGSMWDLLQIEYTRGILDHLGYPHYLLIILGAWKLPYAGATFNYTGAAASHLLAGDGPWAAPLVFALLTLGSWALRPPDRRLPDAGPRSSSRLAAWLVPLGLVVVLLIVSLLTLPKGPAPA